MNARCARKTNNNEFYLYTRYTYLLRRKLDSTYNFPNKSEQTLRDSKTPKMLARKLANSAIFHIKYEKSAVLPRLGDK